MIAVSLCQCNHRKHFKQVLEWMNEWMRHVKREVCLLPVPTRPMSCSHRFLLTTTLSNLPQNVFFFWHPAYEEYILTFSLRFMIVADALHLHTLQPDQRISGSVLRSSSPGPTQCFFLSNSLNAPSLPAIQLYIQPIIIAEGHISSLNRQTVDFKLLVKQNKVLLMCTV